MENSYCFKENYSYDPSLDLSWGSGLSLPPSLLPNELEDILSGSNTSGSDSASPYPPLSMSLQFYLSENCYSSNKGRYLKVLKHHLGHQLVFVARDKTIYLSLNLSPTSAISEESSRLLSISVRPEFEEHLDETTPCSSLFEFQGYHGYQNSASLAECNPRGVKIPFKSVRNLPDLQNKCVFGLKFMHLNSKFSKKPIFVKISLHNSSVQLAEVRFQLMCCSTPARDIVRYTQRNPHSAVPLEVQSIAEALAEPAVPVNMRKRKYETDSEGEVERESSNKKKRYTIQTTDFGIYCVLQRMAHELTNYREQLRMKN